MAKLAVPIGVDAERHIRNRVVEFHRMVTIPNRIPREVRTPE